MGALNGPHILGTLVPVEEPSTASKPEVGRILTGDSRVQENGFVWKIFSWLRQLLHGSQLGASSVGT
jgi:hypothetical protein